MRMMNELKPLYLYPATKLVYAPINEKDKRHGAAIKLLTPSLEASVKMTNLPYVINPSLFTSFYIHSDVMMYLDKKDIKDLNFDEKEEESISEAMRRNWNSKVKIKFDEDISILDKRLAEDVINSRVSWDLARRLRLSYFPEQIKVFVYPTISALQKDAPASIKSVYKDKLYSYSNGNEIHILSKRVYDKETMGGPYELYLKNELICNLVLQCNPDLYLIPVMAIAQVKSGLTQWIKDNKDNYDLSIGTDECNTFAKVIYDMQKNKKDDMINRFLKTGDINLFTKYTVYNNIGKLKKLIFESELSYFERQRLLPSDFGIPDKRKYPMPDEEHVRAAIRMFNNCDPSDEEELAKSIIKKLNKFGITDVKISAANRFKQYYDAEQMKAKAEGKDDEFKLNFKLPEGIKKIPEKVKEKGKELVDKVKDSIKKEEALLESFVDSDYGDILHICNHLSPDELSRITFYDTYRDSPFVIKRIIKRVGGEPAGFLDVYQFPSKPEIAQITIAVDSRFRGQHIADDMVKELLASNLHKTHDFFMYYWTAHPDNYASQQLALKNGFFDMHLEDNYGRKIFTMQVSFYDNQVRCLPDELLPKDGEDFKETETSFVTENMALFTEADDSQMTSTLKRYLYNQRLKTSRDTFNYYDRVKQMNPDIKYTYLKLDMYKLRNLYVDLSYYHGIFLAQNKFKMDKAVNFYFEFINKLLKNNDIDSTYKRQTIFIPVDHGIWSVEMDTDPFDYKKNLNPISIIFRLIRTNPGGLKKAWGNKNIIFVGQRGYFTVDFKTFELKNLARFKSNLIKLMSNDQKIIDDYELDDIDDDDTNDAGENKANTITSKALAAKMVDRVEQGTSIKIDNVSAIGTSVEIEPSPHLEIIDEPLDIDVNKKSVAILSLDPEGSEGYERLSRTVLSNIGSISNYCIPKE